MAIYYVRTDGSDSNAGTGPATNQAWQTITKAIGATGIAPGDTLYIAPGIYRGSFTAAFTNPANEGQRITISGDPTASQFSGVTAGPIILTNYTSTTSTSGTRTLDIEKPYVTISNIHVNGFVAGSGPNFGRFANIGTNAIILTKCAFYQSTQSTDVTNSVGININQGTSGAIIQNCIFNAPVVFGPSTTTTAAYNSNTTVQDCIFQSTSFTAQSAVVTLYGGSGGAHFGGIKFYNCSFLGLTGIAGLTASNLSTAFPSSAQNCYFESRIGIQMNTNNGQFTESYNVFQCGNARSNVANGTGSVTNAFVSLDVSMSRITGWGNYPHYAHHLGTYPISSGLSTGAPAADIYGVTWLAPSTPTMGAMEYFDYSLTGRYVPTERNASTITIAPGSTSQTIELYLGVTGLTASTSGLSARYNRTRTASVSISLVARTIAQAWTAGGFAEVDATHMPGVYRLDVPDAALAAGADDVTIVVRGASGTNGAVMTIKLSSGGLSSTETAQAVWNATASSYNTAGSMGEAGQRLTGYSLASSQTFSTTGSVGSVTGAVTVGTNNDKTGYALSSAANTSAADAVWNSTRSTHTTAGTFGEYVNAELVTPVTQSALVRMGPFQVIADGVTTPMPLDVQKGAQHGIDIQCVDNNLSAIDITSATVTAKVYNSGGSLVDTYSCTATYAADGRATFTIDTTVTNVPGTYTATITRTTGASDTQVFGPLRIYVRDI